MESIIQFQNVTRRFGKTVALNDFSLEVPRGVVCALLGANGAGKTTAIQVLLGLDRPQQGRSLVMGMESHRFSREIRQRIGYVADQPALYDWMTVEEIGWFTSGFYPWGFADEYSKNIQRLGLDPQKRIRDLSREMMSKVSLSLAISHQPDLLVMDEPTSGLDPLVRREFLESMVDMAGAGSTVFLSSHQVPEVERVADIVVILLDGRVAHTAYLDDLKSSVHEVVVTLPNPGAPHPQPRGDVLAQLAIGHEQLWMVRNFEPGPFVDACRNQGLPEPQIRQPHLEDILLAMLREYRKPVQNSNASETPLASR